MDTSLLPVVSGNENSDNKETAQKTTYFRGKQIAWITDERHITRTTQNAFDSANPDKDEVLKHYNLILYDGKTYERAQFLKDMFADYMKYPYKVKFNTNNIFCLGSSQRAKLQYHILAQQYGLVQVAEQDKEELEAFCGTSNSDLAQKWLYRMSWKNGHESMISFGVALEVAGKASGVWCYHADTDEERATFSGQPMTWEEWEQGIIKFVTKRRIQLKSDNQLLKDNDSQCEKALYYQDKAFLTLPKTESDKLKLWLSKYIRYGNVKFPYSGEMPNGELRFTIDFEKDIEITPSFKYALKYPEQAAEWNSINNAVHNREDIGRKKVAKTFSGLAGDEWTTAEIREQGFNDKNIGRFVDYGFIERTKKGHYRRVTR
jgi:hypothetical protein